MKKMQVKAKPRRRAFPPRHRQMPLFIKSLQHDGAKNPDALQYREQILMLSQILRVHFAVIILNPLHKLFFYCGFGQ